MPKQYKSARGKPIDMGAFVSQHENIRAIGNMNVNARGEEVDSVNRPVRSRNQKVQRHYDTQIEKKIVVPAIQEDPVVFPADVEEEDAADWEPLAEQTTSAVEPVKLEEKEPTKAKGLASAIQRAKEVKKNG